MKSGFRLMKIRGIDVRLDWSLVIIGLFISFSLAVDYFPAALPGWGAAAYLTAALFSFIGLYASVLLHELAHAVVSQKRGIKVESIVLNFFGGVSNLKEEPRRSRDEFWISVVGPLTSLNLGGAFLILAFLTQASVPALAAIAGYLAVVNFMLGVFNLIPAYPLDGGRILRALVWSRTGNLVKATRWVATVGRGFGWAFIFFGVLIALNGAIFSGLWLAFIGWFLNGSSRMGYAQTIATQTLQGVKVGQVTSQAGRWLGPNTRLDEVAQAFFGTERGRVLPVVENGYLLGVLNLEALRQIKPADWSQTPVSSVMLRRGSLLAYRPDEDLQATIALMTAKPALYAAVIGDGGQFAGLFYLADVPRYIEMQQTLGLLDQNGNRPELPKSDGPSGNEDNSNRPQQPRPLDKVA